MNWKRALQPALNAIFKFIERRFTTGFCLALTQVMRDKCISYRPSQSSPLGSAPLCIPIDRFIFPAVYRYGHWQVDHSDLLATQVRLGVSYTLVDIGAHVGLFTRQVLHRHPQFERAVCVEPEPENHRLLRMNTAHLCSRIDYLQCGISDHDGFQQLHIDRENTCHHSFVDGTGGISVETMTPWKLADVILDALPDGHRLAIKCDTEGLDEYILSALPQAIWDKTDCCIVEISRCEKAGVDWPAVEHLFGSFSKRVWADNETTNVSAQDVVRFARQPSGDARDVVLAR